MAGVVTSNWLLAPGILADLQRAAARAWPLEACGLLLGRAGAVSALVELPNVHATPERAFELDPAGLLGAHRQARLGGRAIAGCWHSHPAGPPTPSPTDHERADVTGWLWLICGDRANGWRVGAFEATRPGLLSPASVSEG